MASLARPTPHALISTKLVPPRQVGAMLARERLLHRMLDARRFRSIAVYGGAGAGKTSLLSAYQQSITSLGFEVAWLSLSPDDDDPAQVLEYLLASLAHIDPDLVRAAQLQMDLEIDQETTERIMVSLIHALNDYAREVVLVIDDVHLLSKKVLDTSALQFLLEHAPLHFHIVLAARHPVPLALERLQAEGQLLELGPKDLQFTLEETAAYVHELTGTLDTREAIRLHQLSDGWPAGLRLLTMNWHRGNHAVSSPIHDPDSFAHYFEQEVLSQLNATEVTQLVTLSVSTRFCMRLAGVLLAHEGTAAVIDASRLIARIERENLFIVPLDSADHERWYRLHPLLREVLLRRFHDRPPACQQKLHRRAASWFETEGLIDEAVQHRLDAGEEQAAARLLETCADILQLRAYRGMASLLRRLPPEVIARHTKLRLLHIGLLMRMRQYEACRQAQDALAQDLPSDAVHERVHLTLARAALAVQRDDTDTARALLTTLGALPPDADAWMIGSWKNLLSLIRLHEGDFEGARQAQDDGPPRLLRGQPLLATTGGILAGRCLIGLSHAKEGNIQRAEQIYREVLKDAEGVDADCRDAMFLATALLGEALYERNEATAAINLLEPQIDLLERFSLPDTVIRGLLTLARAHRLLGHWLESQAYLERLEDLGRSRGLDRLYASALLEQAKDCLRRYDLAAAARLNARLDTLAAKHADHGGSLAEIRNLAVGAQIRHALVRGEVSLAAAQLSEFTAHCSAQRNWQRVARLKLLSAIVAQADKRENQAQLWMQEALRLGHRYGLMRSLLDAHPDAAEHVRELSARIPLDPVLQFYVTRLLATPHSVDAPPSPASGGTAEPLTQREADVLRMLALALPNKKIARTLGLSIETVKWHLRNVYRKLDVAGRDDAVARARDFGLIHEPVIPPGLAHPPSSRGG